MCAAMTGFIWDLCADQLCRLKLCVKSRIFFSFSLNFTHSHEAILFGSLKIWRLIVYTSVILFFYFYFYFYVSFFCLRISIIGWSVFVDIYSVLSRTHTRNALIFYASKSAMPKLLSFSSSFALQIPSKTSCFWWQFLQSMGQFVQLNTCQCWAKPEFIFLYSK